MKIFILLFLLIASPLSGQQRSKTLPKAAITSTIYGVSDFKGSSLPVIGVGVEWMVGKNIFYYGKLQYNYRFGDFLPIPMQFIDPMALEFQLLGVGFYLFDTRKNATGWTMTLNLATGMGINFGVQDAYDAWANENLNIWTNAGKVLELVFYAPIEGSLYVRYHINPMMAFQFGINFAGHIGIHTTFLYGFNIGFAF